MDRASYREGGLLHRRCHYVTKSTGIYEITIAIMSLSNCQNHNYVLPHTYKGHGQKPKMQSAIMSSNINQKCNYVHNINGDIMALCS